jgi:diacylglycerol kinase (CTP)
VPRKALHVSIGFITLYLYSRGTQISQIHPVLLSLLVPIFSTDVLRFRFPALNAVYIRVLGPFMRESEAHDRYNGVISYLAGLWVTMRFCHKDVAVMSVLLLSWSDTAASTIGRAYGRYTPRIRRGKSLAGSLAAFVVGVGSAVLFYEVVVPAYGRELVEGFAFRGELLLPEPVREVLGLGVKEARIEGPVAMGAFALVSGFVASFSEALDVFGLDDNLTIPILSSIGLGAFLWAFAS